MRECSSLDVIKDSICSHFPRCDDRGDLHEVGPRSGDEINAFYHMDWLVPVVAASAILARSCSGSRGRMFTPHRNYLADLVLMGKNEVICRQYFVFRRRPSLGWNAAFLNAWLSS